MAREVADDLRAARRNRKVSQGPPVDAAGTTIAFGDGVTFGRGRLEP
jgi:hypothetical protein